MTKKQFAAMLSGREYGKEITRKECALAEEHGLVVVFGYSDDAMEFRGAINDEVGCYDGGVVLLEKDGIFNPYSYCDNYNEDRPCKFIKAATEQCKTIEAVWCNSDGTPWTYETDIPHETFDIYEDGELWCVGIVFDMAAL